MKKKIDIVILSNYLNNIEITICELLDEQGISYQVSRDINRFDKLNYVRCLDVILIVDSLSSHSDSFLELLAITTKLHRHLIIAEQDDINLEKLYNYVPSYKTGNYDIIHYKNFQTPLVAQYMLYLTLTYRDIYQKRYKYDLIRVCENIELCKTLRFICTFQTTNIEQLKMVMKISDKVASNYLAEATHLEIVQMVNCRSGQKQFILTQDMFARLIPKVYAQAIKKKMTRQEQINNVTNLIITNKEDLKNVMKDYTVDNLNKSFRNLYSSYVHHTKLPENNEILRVLLFLNVVKYEDGYMIPIIPLKDIIYIRVLLERLITEEDLLEYNNYYLLYAPCDKRRIDEILIDTACGTYEENIVKASAVIAFITINFLKDETCMQILTSRQENKQKIIYVYMNNYLTRYPLNEEDIIINKWSYQKKTDFIKKYQAAIKQQ